jgi:hypothetical protein
LLRYSNIMGHSLTLSDVGVTGKPNMATITGSTNARLSI